MRKLLVPLFLLMSSIVFGQTPPIEPGVSQELAKWRAAHYSDVRYKLSLTLEKMSPVLKGSIEIRVQHSVMTQTEPVPLYLVLDWRKIRGHENLSTISNVKINGYPVTKADQNAIEPGRQLFVVKALKATDLKFYEQKEHLIFSDGVDMGENVIKLDFTSPILTSGSAITRYVDKEDGSEYIYSLFVPSDASTAFPVFDQPDLKARFSLSGSIPEDWTAISNSDGARGIGDCVDVGKPDPKGCPQPFIFSETKPISTYVFAFASGPWEKVSAPGAADRAVPPAVAGGLTRSQHKTGVTETRSDISGPSTGSVQPPATAGGTDSTAGLETSIYVRKSQAAKFKPHAAEVFRLNREAVKYFEQYFDYKFPFPKYDLVLIPEFPFGGMEHAGATFLREASIIFPQEPTKNDLVNRATLIFHETAHQWFGDTVTMRWFDDLWLKEGFATFTAYKALEKIMPEMNAWKVFYERIKQGAYQTDSTKGTTPIYQEIKNLSAAKSAYGNIVYNKAPAFLRQAEFYLGEDKFQTAVRAFLKKHEFGNAGWEDLVNAFEEASKQNLEEWANVWVKQRGVPTIQATLGGFDGAGSTYSESYTTYKFEQKGMLNSGIKWNQRFRTLLIGKDDTKNELSVRLADQSDAPFYKLVDRNGRQKSYLNNEVTKKLLYPSAIFPNYGDYGYGIFLLDEKSREHGLKNIQNEKDPFLRSMMWGALWDSVREGELDPREYVELAIKNLRDEPDESIAASILGRTGTALNYYLSEPRAATASIPSDGGKKKPIASAQGPHKNDLRSRVEDLLIDRMEKAPTPGQRITFYRAFLSIAASERARGVLNALLATSGQSMTTPLTVKTKDKFDIVTRLLILNDPEAPKLLADLEKTETGDDAKRYAYAAKAGIPTAENKAKYWNDFTNNKEISESWIEAAFGPWNSIRHSDLTLPYLQKALQELPNHKRNRKIFFVNGWLGAFIGGQRSEEALTIVNKFLAENPDLDKDLRLKVLENADLIERAVKIRKAFPGI